MRFKSTLGNLEWLKSNEDRLKQLFPDTWTHLENVNVVRIGYGFKLFGIDWSSHKDLARILLFFEKIGFILRDGYTIRRNTNSIFK